MAGLPKMTRHGGSIEVGHALPLHVCRCIPRCPEQRRHPPRKPHADPGRIEARRRRAQGSKPGFGGVRRWTEPVERGGECPWRGGLGIDPAVVARSAEEHVQGAARSRSPAMADARREGKTA